MVNGPEAFAFPVTIVIGIVIKTQRAIRVAIPSEAHERVRRISDFCLQQKSNGTTAKEMAKSLDR